jgi:hypothetical protein
LFRDGLFIDESFNNANSIFRSLKYREGGQLAQAVTLEKRV